MGSPVFQKSFNSGEWAPQLYSRVDLEKYKSGAALIRNFFVDYRGGVSTRMGTEYILQAYQSATPVRIIPFQASTTVSYILEFGNYYIRFYNNGAPILEATNPITAISQANPCVVTVANTYAIGDWVFISGVVGMTQLNGNYYSVLAAAAGAITLGDLNGNQIDSTGFTAYTSGGTTARVYTLASPYAAADIGLIKFAQDVNALILCHPNYAPNILTETTYNNWSMNPINFGTPAGVPTGVAVTTTLSFGSCNYSYIVTSVDGAGNESAASAPGSLLAKQDLLAVKGSNSITWTGVPGGASYNVYKSDVSYFGAIPVGVPYGFIGNVLGTTFIDSNIAADFTLAPPIIGDPFYGAPVISITQGAHGTYTTVPAVTLTGGNPLTVATATATLGATAAGVNFGGAYYLVGQTITLSNNVVLTVTAVNPANSYTILAVKITNPGAITSGSTPANPQLQLSTSGGGVGASFNLTWGVVSTQITYGGTGYVTPPAVGYSVGGASGTAVLGSITNNNPAVPSFFQQRLVLSNLGSDPEQMNFSQPGRYFNYDTSLPIIPSDAIQVSLSSGQIETIKSMVAAASGLVVFTDKASWVVNGGGYGTAISPSSIVANRQSFNGASDVPPILNNYDIIFVEAKGSAVRDATYNFYAQVYTGQDISAVSSHLFFGYQILQWAWAQAPFKIVWAVRNDGELLSLTFAKEEEFIAWARHDTQGSFKSVATVSEVIPDGMLIDAVYFVVQRTINGNTIQYIERMADRVFNGQVSNAWCVDAGIQYSGSPATSFSGAQQLAGAIVTGLADGVVIPRFTMPVSGMFTLGTPASLVTVGLAFTPQLQTLPIDVGEPTIQSRQKKIDAVSVRCVDALGLSIGSSFNSLVSMKDLVVGNVGSQTNQIVTDLVTGDAFTFVDPLWSAQGQFCIQQSLPFPATITGVIPRITGGDKG